MAYIGKTPITGNFVKLDAISVVNGQAAYTMNNGGSAFTDYENVNQFLVSLNGILQAPTDSFTVSGSTLTFASNLATGDVIDFVIVLGNTLDIGTPSDATVTQAKTNFVSTSSSAGLQIKGDNTTAGTLQLNCEQNSHGIKLRSPAHSSSQSYTLTFPTGNVTADKFLKVASVSGSGTTGIGQLSFADAGGTFNKIATADYSSGVSSFTFTDCFTSTYSLYKVYVYDIAIATDVNNELRVYFQDSSNSDVNGWVAAAQGYYIADDGGSAGDGSEAGGVSDYIRMGHADFDESANQVSALEMTIFQPYESTNTLASYQLQLRADNSRFYSIYGGARLNVNTSLENLKFQTSAGANFQSYKSVIYGIKR